MNCRYTGQQLCVLIPTKDRPEHVETLLQSLIDQIEPVGRILIVASGADIQSTVDKFSSRLPIEYHHTFQTGQIRQRNIGIGKLDDRTPLVACIDDDIVLASDSVKEMVLFWNRAPINTGGVGFNITNGSTDRPSLLHQILFLSHRQPGQVLHSGTSTSISCLQKDIHSQWLTGGTTVWRKDILINFRHKEINTKWAIAEDLIFSYPVGKIFPLYVCANARVTHNHYPYNSKDNQWHFFHGKTQTIWTYFFVNSHKELSTNLFFISLFIRILGKIAYGLIGRKPHLVSFALGALTATGEITRHALSQSRKQDIREN